MGQGKEINDMQFLCDPLVGETIKDVWVETVKKLNAKLRNLNFIQ